MREHTKSRTPIFATSSSADVIPRTSNSWSTKSRETRIRGKRASGEHDQPGRRRAQRQLSRRPHPAGRYRRAGQSQQFEHEAHAKNADSHDNVATAKNRQEFYARSGFIRGKKLPVFRRSQQFNEWGYCLGVQNASDHRTQYNQKDTGRHHAQCHLVGHTPVCEGSTDPRKLV